MKRFHVHMSVNNLSQSIRFYSTLFGAEPSRVEADYAKWMLEDPRMNKVEAGAQTGCCSYR
jgi:catechol 2,3-dioxygenase-like lactoylglutathione lyase family enzyme